jgi:hypothetical protein
MARSKGLTPGLIVAKFRENQNNNGTLKSLFAGQLLGKFETRELDGLIKSIEKEKARREESEIQKLKELLESKGFEVTKK